METNNNSHWDYEDAPSKSWSLSGSINLGMQNLNVDNFLNLSKNIPTHNIEIESLTPQSGSVSIKTKVKGKQYARPFFIVRHLRNISVIVDECGSVDNKNDGNKEFTVSFRVVGFPPIFPVSK